MSLHLYFSFLLTSAVLILSPGPVNVLVMSLALRDGWRSTLPSVWGATFAVMLQLLLTALSLGSLLHLSADAFGYLRWAGAGFLAYLGWKQWHAAPAIDVLLQRESASSQFWRGFATSGLNPKSLLFFPAFFPQFIQADAAWSQQTQFVLLAWSFALVFIAGVIFNALCSHKLRGWLGNPLRVRWSNRVLGSLLIAMGALLVGSR